MGNARTGFVDCPKHGASAAARISRGVQLLMAQSSPPPRSTQIRRKGIVIGPAEEVCELWVLTSEWRHLGFDTFDGEVYKPIANTRPLTDLMQSGKEICSFCLRELETVLHDRSCLHLRLRKDESGSFCATIDEFPQFLVVAGDADAALRQVVEALSAMQQTGADLPIPAYGDWFEYVHHALRPMGKMPFGELPSSARILRRGFPTMIDKTSSENAIPLDGSHEFMQIPADEIVWHHVFGDLFSAEERAERILWTGNPDLHF